MTWNIDGLPALLRRLKNVKTSRALVAFWALIYPHHIILAFMGLRPASHFGQRNTYSLPEGKDFSINIDFFYQIRSTANCGLPWLLRVFELLLWLFELN
jgi:hypothetical protein